MEGDVAMGSEPMAPKVAAFHTAKLTPTLRMGEKEDLYVRDGKVVTAAGVSAGIDMALWLVGQIAGVDAAREAQRQMEYDPAPPYAAEV